MSKSDSLERQIRLACRAEVLARKPGNVHPWASFEDLRFEDFLTAADAAAPALAQAESVGIGHAVFDAVRATRERCATNINLGICLLIAPCAATAPSIDFRVGVEQTLSRLTVKDAAWAYRAIRLAAPGGLGESTEQDVSEEPTVSLREAMRLAANRDANAAQYANGFRDVQDIGVTTLAREFQHDPERAILLTQLEFMAAIPDSLIARKCGVHVAEESVIRAKQALNAGAVSYESLSDLDHWLRADGHRRNPGTTADLIAASLFVALRWNRIEESVLSAWCDQRLAEISR